MITKTEKKCISDMYLMIINEYFTKFAESCICNYEINSNFNDYKPIDYQLNCNLFTGILIINRVFEYTFIKTKNISTTYFYSNEAYVYYLEYMEQIYQANLSQNVNHSDAILFVYKKTIFELLDNDNVSELSTSSIEIGGKGILSNIIQSNRDNHSLTHILNDEFKSIFLVVTKIVKILLVSNDNNPTYSSRIEFCKKYLEPFFKNIEKLSNLINKLDILHQNLEFNQNTWKRFLKELLLDMNKLQKNKKTISDSDFIIQFYYEKSSIQEKLDNNDFTLAIKWFI
jgi:hypothetical protein